MLWVLLPSDNAFGVIFRLQTFIRVAGTERGSLEKRLGTSCPECTNFPRNNVTAPVKKGKRE